MRIGYLQITWNSRESKVLKELKKNGAIRAIKLTRELTGWGLSDSKGYVDRIRLIYGLNLNGEKVRA